MVGLEFRCIVGTTSLVEISCERVESQGGVIRMGSIGEDRAQRPGC